MQEHRILARSLADESSIGKGLASKVVYGASPTDVDNPLQRTVPSISTLIPVLPALTI